VTPRPAAVACAALLLTACSSTMTPDPGAPSAVPSSSAAVAASSSAPAATPQALTAAALVSGLQAAGLPVTGAIVYTAESDPNHKLGRPGGYTGKAAWSDSRVPSASAPGRNPGDVKLGGSVEVFPDVAGATARGRVIQAFSQASGLLGEYDYAAGGVLLRLSDVLTPTQAAGYAAALSKLTGVAAVPVGK